LFTSAFLQMHSIPLSAKGNIKSIVIPAVKPIPQLVVNETCDVVAFVGIEVDPCLSVCESLKFGRLVLSVDKPRRVVFGVLVSSGPLPRFLLLRSFSGSRELVEECCPIPASSIAGLMCSKREKILGMLLKVAIATPDTGTGSSHSPLTFRPSCYP